MENRFGLKDFLILSLLVVVIIMVALAMRQFDRQWSHVQAIRRTLDDQGQQIASIQNAIERGAKIASPSTRAADNQPAGDSFDRIRRAKAMPGYAEGDWLIQAFSGTVATLTPLRSADQSASVVQSYVLESLADRDPDTLEWQGQIARDWKTSDDGLSIVFNMRDDVTFSDGQPLKPSDVVFTFKFTMDEKIAAPRQRAYYGRIKSVEQTGPNQVTFTYNEPYFNSFQLAAGMAILPEHYYSKFTPQQFNESKCLLLGSGPYKLQDPESWTPGSQIVLVRNDRYWGVRPAIARLVWKQISQDVARLTEFRNGDIDTFAAQPEQYVRMVKDQAILNRSNHFEYLSPTGGYRYIAWNQVRDGKPTRFADKRVRQAMTLMIDRDQLIQECYLGYAVKATGPFSPLSKQCSPNVKGWPYDMQRAMALLKEAGYEDRNGDGLLEGPDGKPFEIRLTYPSGNASYEKQALLIKDAFARAGIALIPDPTEWGAFTQRLRNHNFDAISLGWTANLEGDLYQAFHSSQIKDNGDDFVSYRNEELDALIDKARTTVNEADRMPMWRKCHEIINEDQPYTFLFFPKSLPFVDKRIRNVQVTKVGLNALVEWYVPGPEQRWTK